MVRLILSILLIGNIAFAEDSVYLNKGDASPYAGWLLDKDKVLDYRNTSLERDTLKLQNDSLNTSLKLQEDIIARKDQQITLYSNQADSLAKTAYSAQNLSTWEKIGYFSLGALLTGLAAYGAIQLVK